MDYCRNLLQLCMVHKATDLSNMKVSGSLLLAWALHLGLCNFKDVKLLLYLL